MADNTNRFKDYFMQQLGVKLPDELSEEDTEDLSSFLEKEITEKINSKNKTPKKLLVVTTRLPEETIDLFKRKCKELGLTQSIVVDGFIQAWNSGEYVASRSDNSYELRRRLVEWAALKGYKVEEVIDALVEYVVSGQIELEDTGE